MPLPRLVKLGGALTLLPAGPSGVVSATTQSGMHKQGEVSIDTTGHTGHHRTTVVVDSATSLRARYGWWSWMDNALSAGSLLLDAELVLDDLSVIPITFDGLSTLTVTLDGSSIFYTDSDVIPGATVTRADVVAVRSYLRAATGTATFGATWYSGTDSLSWYQDGDHMADDPASPPTAPGPEYANTYYCHPIALLGVQS
jgi:hypothetical protein